MKYNLYDFDGTIYDGDSGVDLVFFAIKKGYLNFFKALWYCIKYGLKLYTKEKFKSKMFSFISKIDDLDSFIDEFWAKKEYKIKEFWKNKKSHKNDVIISASCDFWLEPIAKKYKVAALIATIVDKKTGEVVGDNCHGDEKVRLFYQEFPKGIVNEVYTDSVHDLPMIKEAKEGFLVKKDKIIPYFDYKPNFIVRFWRWGWGIYHKNEELWNYLIVGCLTTLVSIGVKWGLYFTILDVDNGIQAQIGVIVSWICAVLFAYVTNRIYVFKSKSKNILKEMASFVGARLLTLGLEALLTFVFFTLMHLTTKLWVVVVTFIIQVLIMVFNYIFSKIFVFKKS